MPSGAVRDGEFVRRTGFKARQSWDPGGAARMSPSPVGKTGASRHLVTVSARGESPSAFSPDVVHESPPVQHQDRLSRSENWRTINRLNKNRTGGRLEQKLALVQHGSARGVSLPLDSRDPCHRSRSAVRLHGIEQTGTGHRVHPFDSRARMLTEQQAPLWVRCRTRNLPFDVLFRQGMPRGLAERVPYDEKHSSNRPPSSPKRKLSVRKCEKHRDA